LVLLAIAPLFLSDFRTNLLGKFIAFAVLALGIDLIWGYTGILSLGHGVYFGLGANCMAMYLKLEASEENCLILCPGAGRKHCPGSGSLSLMHPWQSYYLFVVPVVLALVVGYLTFKNRIKGVYSLYSDSSSFHHFCCFVCRSAGLYGRYQRYYQF
jgi:urea transport system permease protein